MSARSQAQAPGEAGVTALAAPLAERVALVTGSTQGLGEGIALALAVAGASVFVNGRSTAKGDAVVRRLGARGAVVRFIQADLTRRDEAFRLVQTAAADRDRLDILVNNAQITPPLIEAEDARTDGALEQALASGLYASLWTAQAALPWLVRSGRGRIVNVASINGAFGSRYGAAYNATKEAIRGLTRTLANEWGRHGIAVNAVLPAGLSPAYEAFYRDDPRRAQAVERANPMRRHGRPLEDIGAAITGLVSDEARYITGESLYIDGGAHLHGLPQLHPPGIVFQ